MGSVARPECVQRRVTVRVVASRRREPRLRRGQLVVLPLLVHVDLLRLGLLRLLLPLRHRLLLHLHLRGRGDLRTTRRQLQQLRNVPDRSHTAQLARARTTWYHRRQKGPRTSPACQAAR